MAKNTQIEWTHHTFNPWWGCTQVSPACDHCYAELWAKRMGHRVWGQKAPRRFFGDAHWKEPLEWDEQSKFNGIRERVFCASMADVFERRAELNDSRKKLWKLIEATPNLDWLLLTKRPQNVEQMVPWTSRWPRNVWLGTTVENQKFASQRLPFLLKHRAAVRFLSCEPLLGPLDLTPWLKKSAQARIDWVIAGGESGPGARPMHPDWAKGLLQQCRTADVPFHFKQWGHWIPAEVLEDDRESKVTTEEIGTTRKVIMAAVGKKRAGRILDGETWDGLPTGEILINA